MSSVLNRLVGVQWMERLISTAARMVSPNPAGRFQPQRPKNENEEETCTWFSTRYPPTTARIRPEKNVPTPPGVPPAPLNRPDLSSAFASSNSASSAVCPGRSIVGMASILPLPARGPKFPSPDPVSNGESAQRENRFQTPARVRQLVRRELAVHPVQPQDLERALHQRRRRAPGIPLARRRQHGGQHRRFLWQEDGGRFPEPDARGRVGAVDPVAPFGH